MPGLRGVVVVPVVRVLIRCVPVRATGPPVDHRCREHPAVQGERYGAQRLGDRPGRPGEIAGCRIDSSVPALLDDPGHRVHRPAGPGVETVGLDHPVGRGPDRVRRPSRYPVVRRLRQQLRPRGLGGPHPTGVGRGEAPSAHPGPPPCRGGGGPPGQPRQQRGPPHEAGGARPPAPGGAGGRTPGGRGGGGGGAGGGGGPGGGPPASFPAAPASGAAVSSGAGGGGAADSAGWSSERSPVSPAASATYGGTIARPSLRGVGSNVVQPAPGNHASTHAWASAVLTERTSSASRPPVKPTATRAGTPRVRSITAIAEANCSQ